MSIVYQDNIVMGTNKVGTIKADANGYREVVLGAFNVDNSAGAFYPLEPVKSLLLDSSDLIRRMKSRALRSEYGHPRRENMTPVQFLARVMDIREQLTCNHICMIELDEKRVVDDVTGRTVAAIIGWVLPSGPYGAALEKQFENPEENVCYSIRSITNDRYDACNKLLKEIKQIVTWDYVNEPGIRFANKLFSPSLESLSSGETIIEPSYAIFNEETILAAREYVKETNIGNESMASMFDQLLTKGSVETRYGTFYKEPSSSRWMC